MLFECLECRKDYSCNKTNTTVFGPILNTKCPRCGNAVSKNLSKFLEDQTYKVPGRVGSAIKMITMAKWIGKNINEENDNKKENTNR